MTLKTDYHTDSAAPCWSCGGTIATYTVDPTVSLVSVYCHGCNRGDLFARTREMNSAAELSAAHRKELRS